MKKIMVTVMATVMVCLSIVGCSNGSEEQKKKEMIQSVLEVMLNCPNKELIQLKEEMNAEIESMLNSGNVDLSSSNLQDTKLYQRLEELYSPYFTDEGYEQLVANRQLLEYHLSMDEQGAQMKLDKVEIKKSDADSVFQYTFTITISIISANGAEKTTQATGKAEIDKDSNKISYFVVSDVPIN